MPPIKPENASLYPPEWPAISREAKERAGWKCQHPGCTAGQYDVGFWEGDTWHRHGSVGHELHDAYKQARQMAAEIQWDITGDVGNPDPKVIVIVLTTAHLEHDPTDCRPEALAVLCQRHHLRHDVAHHRTTAYTTRMQKRGNLELPL